jgi:hypothetical protein
LVSVPEPGDAAELCEPELSRARRCACIHGWATDGTGRCTARRDLYEARQDPREGDERLSAKKRSESEEAGHARPAKTPSPDKSNRKQRSTDLGRALRTIYDDTLRESVPDDFMHLIGKLS